jgi:hypothetical protein
MNLPNVVDLDLMHEMLHLMDDRSQSDSFIWNREDKEEFREAFVNGCRLVAEALTAELGKCFNEGKSLILEGTFIGPDLLDLLKSLIQTRALTRHDCCPAVTVFFNLEWSTEKLHQNHMNENFGHLFGDENHLIWSRIKMLHNELKVSNGFHKVIVDDFSKALERMHDIVLESLDSIFKEAASG